MRRAVSFAGTKLFCWIISTSSWWYEVLLVLFKYNKTIIKQKKENQTRKYITNNLSNISGNIQSTHKKDKKLQKVKSKNLKFQN